MSQIKSTGLDILNNQSLSIYMQVLKYRDFCNRTQLLDNKKEKDGASVNDAPTATANAAQVLHRDT